MKKLLVLRNSFILLGSLHCVFGITNFCIAEGKGVSESSKIGYDTHAPKTSNSDVVTRSEAPNKTFVIPPIMEQNDIMKELFLEYISSAEKAPVWSLAPDDEHGFRCEVYSIKTGKLEIVDLNFKTAEFGRGRFLDLRLENPGQIKAQTYLLSKGKSGFRGTTKDAEDTIAIKKHHLTERRLSATLEDAYKSTWISTISKLPGILDLDGLKLSTVEPFEEASILRFPSVAIMQNTNDPDELFIELGSKSSVSAVDINGDPLFTGPFNVRGYSKNRSSGAGYTPDANFIAASYKTLKDIKDTFLTSVFGNLDLPYSYAFKDVAPEGNSENGDLYRMESIGVCVRIKKDGKK